ncbi:MAG: hypothetical protein NDJ89_05685 [Oligoflexia bacterium]|nr:hypothetical protein [Oligoflexia bacterium]
MRFLILLISSFVVNASEADTVSKMLDADRATEQALFKQAGGVFSRPKPGTLKLKLTNGKEKEFLDNPSDGDTHVNYALQKLYPKAGFALLHLALYEGEDYLLLRLSDGWNTVLPDLPVWSPDFAFFAIAHDGGEAQYTPDEVAIWSCAATERGCERIWQTPRDPETRVSTYAGRRALWKSKNTVELTMSRNDKSFSAVCMCQIKACRCSPDPQ